MSVTNCGTGTAAATTCLDLAGVSAGGSNQNASAVDVEGGITAPGSTISVNDHFNSLTATDTYNGWWRMGQQIAGCRNFSIDSHTAAPISNACGTPQISGGPGVPSGTCTTGSSYLNSAATSASTVSYVCYPANTWTAITVP